MITDAFSHNTDTLPRKHFLFSKTSWRLFEDVFSVTIFHLTRHLQDDFKTSSRCVYKTSSKDVIKTSSRRLHNVFARRLQVVFKTCSRRICKTCSSRRLQEVFKTSSRRRLAIMSWRRLERQKKVALKTSSRRLQDVFSTSSSKRMFARLKVVSRVEWPGSFWMFSSYSLLKKQPPSCKICQLLSQSSVWVFDVTKGGIFKVIIRKLYISWSH